MGSMSFWLSEVGFGLTFVYYTIILYNLGIKFKLPSAATRMAVTTRSIPISSRTPILFLIMTSFIAFVYTIAFAMVIKNMVAMFTGADPAPWDNRFIAAILEAGFLALEVLVMVRIMFHVHTETTARLNV